MPDHATRLRAAGLRVTEPRLALLHALEETPHATVDELATAVRAERGSVSTQAVYDALEAFVRADIVRRIEPAGSPARFESRVGDNHHHVVCRRCGATADVDCAVGRRPCLTPNESSGFVVDEADVTYWGTCPRCQEKERLA